MAALAGKALLSKGGGGGGGFGKFKGMSQLSNQKTSSSPSIPGPMGMFLKAVQKCLPGQVDRAHKKAQEKDEPKQKQESKMKGPKGPGGMMGG